VLAATAMLFLAPAGTASADTGSNWWYARYDVAGAQAAGWTGQGARIAVIDGQINPDLPVFRGANLTVREPGVCGGKAASMTAGANSAHGSDVTALLIGNGTGVGAVRGIAPKAHVTFYADGDEAGNIDCRKTINGTTYTQGGLAIRQAVADGNRIISISQGQSVVEPGDIEAVADAIARGVVIVAGDENRVNRQSGVFPRGANGVIAVNAFANDGTIQKDAGRLVAWSGTTVVAAGVGFPSQAQDNPWRWGGGKQIISGSSLATPLVAGMLALTLQKYPKATGNQLIQSLIRNTGFDDHPLKREEGTGYGYGPASLSHLLRIDPTQYPDANPLMDKDGGKGVPTADDVMRAKAALAAPAATPEGPGAPRAPSSPSGPSLGAFISAGALLTAAAGAVLVRRRRRRRASEQPQQPGSTPPQERPETMALDERFVANLDSLLGYAKPVSLRPVDPTPYRDLIPDALEYLWRKVGVSNWAENSFQLVDPATYAGLIDDVLAGNRFIARDEVVPYGLSAFGQMNLWHRRFGVINIDFPGGRIYYMQKPEVEFDDRRKNIAILANMPNKVVGDFYNLLKPCLKKFGPIGEGEIYGFVPALALGGSEDIKHVQKLRAPEHLSLLSQIAPPQTLYYDSDETSSYGRYVPMD
jgi:hypothetical protein